MPFFKIKNKNILFIHIPKTGGTTIENWLSEHGDMFFYDLEIPSFLKCTPQHLTLDNIRFLFKSINADFVFSIVRDPYEKLESEYFFRTKKILTATNFRPDFSNWAINCLNDYSLDNYFYDNHFKPQVEFLSNKVNVFRYESGLENIIKRLSITLDILPPSKIPNLLQSKRTKLNWSNELLTKFNNIYSNDLEYLNYTIKKPSKKENELY